MAALPTVAAEPELATAPMWATNEGIHLTAPFEVGDHVVGLGLVVPAVLRLEAVPEVLAVRDGEEGWVAPPLRTSEPSRLRDCGRPEPRVARHRERGAGPEARPTRHGVIVPGRARLSVPTL
jgi:hypothetical protein